MIETDEASQQQPLDQCPECTDNDGHEQQRPPVVHAELLHGEVDAERAQHVQRAVGEVDDVEKAEDQRKAKAQDRNIEATVHQTDGDLPEQHL